MSEPTFTEKVETEVSPPAKPEGSPDLIPFKAVPRRRRAELMRKFAKVNDAKTALEAFEGAENGATPEQAALVYDFMADVEEMLAEAAHDPDAYNAWVTPASDNDLMSLLGWYVTTFQVGE